jgi:hypothetical protein
MAKCRVCNLPLHECLARRPFFNFSTRDLANFAKSILDEVIHELSHRTTKRSEDLLDQVKASRLRCGRPGVSDLPEDQLRQRWLNHVLELHRLDLAGASAALVTGHRAEKAEIEAEWCLRRERGFHPAEWHLPANGLFRGKAVPQGSLLRALGYRVGASSPLNDDQRRWLLDEIVSCEMPPVASPSYMEEWGAPLTAIRLERVIRSLRAFGSNAWAYRKMELAREAWLSDARYLERHWLVGSV